MPFPVSPNPGDSYTDAYGTVWVYAGSVNGWYRKTVIPGNETRYTADLITTDKIIDNTIINADIASNAAIAGTKISPNFGSQNVVTTGRVGIGDSAPVASLSVVGGPSVDGSQFPTGNLIGSFSSNVGDTELITFGNQSLNASTFTMAFVPRRAGSVGGQHGWYQKIDSTSAAAASYTLGTLQRASSGGAPETPRFHITSAGLVGIGTTSPSNTFHVAGIARIANSAGGELILEDSDQADGNRPFQRIVSDSGSLVFLNANRSGTGTTGSAERARIDASGRLLVGTPSASGSNLLQVNSDASIYGLTVGRGSGAISANTVVGTSALNANTSGGNNTAIGANALLSNTTGATLTAVGVNALRSNTTSDYNTAFGTNSLFANTTGANNTAVGGQALLSCTTGSGNVQIGSRTAAGLNVPVFTVTTEDNRVVMGSNAVTNAYVQVAWTVVSDARDKTNFGPVPYGLDFVNQLNPTAFQFKVDRDTDEPHGPVRYGFKAQDILALEGDIGVIIDNEDPEKLRYNGEALVPVLVNAIQELTETIKELQAKVASLEAQ